MNSGERTLQGIACAWQVCVVVALGRKKSDAARQTVSVKEHGAWSKEVSVGRSTPERHTVPAASTRP